MRRFLIVLVTALAIYSCDNNIANLGQNLIYTNTYMEVERYDLDQTYIIRLDSFPTSGQTTLTMGHINDPVTGETTATPYFQLYLSSLADDLNMTVTQAMFDSLTLNFTYKGRVAGDTTTLQTFRVYQLTEYPVLDLDDPYQYNNQKLPYDESRLLGKKSFYMQTELMQPQGKTEVDGPYIKLDTEEGIELGKTLFDMMRKQDPIFTGGSTGDLGENSVGRDIYAFMRWFKGLVIVPDENNDFLAAIGSASSELYLRCHYHINEKVSHFDINVLANDEGSFYAFTNVEHSPSDSLKATNGEQAPNGQPLNFNTNSLRFTQTTQAVIQGLDGYMLKIKLPYITEGNVYRTIVKAEIQLNTDYVESSIFPQANQLGVYVMDVQGNIDYVLSDMTGDNAVLGYFEQDPQDASQYRYIIDITDYYITMVESMSTPTNQSMELLIGLPGTLFYSGTKDKTQLINGGNSVTFHKAVFSELPTLNIYYAEYN